MKKISDPRGDIGETKLTREQRKENLVKFIQTTVESAEDPEIFGLTFKAIETDFAGRRIPDIVDFEDVVSAFEIASKTMREKKLNKTHKSVFSATVYLIISVYGKTTVECSAEVSKLHDICKFD